MSAQEFLIFFVTNILYAQYITALIFFVVTGYGYLKFHMVEVNVVTNILGLMCMTIAYKGNIKRKVLAAVSVYLLI